MAEQAKIMTLHDHDTGEAVAPRTDIKALSGEGKKWHYVGFTEDDQLGLIEGTWPCNRNILDNPYFVGGGSQQGGGQFPINQRGKTEYNVSGYTIDRWRSLGTSIIFSLTFAGVKFVSGDNTRIQFTQTVPANSFIQNEKYSFSVLYQSNGPVTLYALNNALIPGAATFPASDTFQVAHTVFTTNDSTKGLLPVIAMDGNAGKSFTIVAAKLELGAQQTLAHQENGEWVLNEIPNYATELAKCQRYYQVFETESLRPEKAQDFRPPMRIKPTLLAIGINGTTYYTADANL